ncbi:hypothetical protein ACLB2K_026082 [Fragaria x ananassa]
MAYNGNNDINGNALYSEGSPSELSCGLMEGNNMGLKKGPWTAVEDRILMEYVSKHGEGNWNAVQRNSGLKRCGKSCRLRWANHLRPNLKKGQFTPEEERLILELHAKYGNKWARMASQLPGRTDNEIKNYWNTRVKKRLRKGLPLYPQDINPSKRVCHSYSHSYDENTMTIPTGLKQLVTSTMPQTDTNFSFQSHPSSSQNQTQLPPRPSQNQHNSTFNHSLPLYDPTTSMPSFNFHHPAQMLGTPLGYKRYQEDIGFSPPISPTRQRNSSILRTTSMPGIASYQQFATGTNSLSDIFSFQFQPQTQTPQLPSSQASHHTRSLSDITTTSHANVINATHSSDGFLEQLLQEAERFGYGSHPIRKQIGGQLDSSDHEKSHAFDGYGHSLASAAMDSSLLEIKPTQDHEQMNSIPKYLAKLFSFNSSTELMPNSNDGESTELPNSSSLEMKPTQDHDDEHINSIPKYLAKLFSFNLSTDQAVPNSYNGESTELPNSQTSGVTEGSHLEFDMQQHMDSFFPAANSRDNLAETSVEVS